MLNELFDYIIFSSGRFQFTIGQLIALLLLIFASRLLWKLTQAKWRLEFYHNHDIEALQRRRFEKYLRQMILLFTSFMAIKLLRLDFELFSIGGINEGKKIIIRYSIFIIALAILVCAWLTEWFFSNVLIHKYEKDRIVENNYIETHNSEAVRNKIIKLVQYVIVLLAGMAIISKFGWNIELFSYNVNKHDVPFTPNSILVIVLIFLMAQIINWVLTQVVLYSVFQKEKIDQGSRYAINQLIKYVIYVIAVVIALNSLQINMTLILGGAAALLVGIGLGLQQTFNDFFSGLVLLFERSVSVGDVMNINGTIGTVKKIGMRSSIIETLDRVSIIVPNSNLVNNAVKNCTHFVDFGRFDVVVGVAYGSDTKLVKNLLLQAVNQNSFILNHPKPFVRFDDFGDSALMFSVHFFCNRFILIEDIKSDIRFTIDDLFRAHNISIPFPQRDVWMRTE